MNPVANSRSYTAGGYYRYTVQGGDPGNTNDYRGGVLDSNWRFFDDLYIDSSLARVVLADDSVYNNATIVEPQIPQTWTDTGITVEVNTGAFPNGTAYVFVFDSLGVPNATGYSVTVADAAPKQVTTTVHKIK